MQALSNPERVCKLTDESSTSRGYAYVEASNPRYLIRKPTKVSVSLQPTHVAETGGVKTSICDVFVVNAEDIGQILTESHRIANVVQHIIYCVVYIGD